MKLQAWIAANPHADLSVGGLADYMGMSKRNLARHFFDHTGMTPAKAVEKIRLESVCRALQTPELSIKCIALYFGFGEENGLS